MIWMWRFAVGVVILVFLEFALSSPSQQRDLKKSESIKHSNQNVVRSQHREKRFLGSMDIYGVVFGLATFAYGESSDDNDQIKQSLQNIEQRLDSEFSRLGDTMQELRNDHRWLEGATMYANSIERLQYILHTLNQFSLNDAGELQPASEVRLWAESILSQTGRSIGEVLFSMHNMVKGTTHLFGNSPILTLVNNTLDPTSNDYSVKLRNFASFMYNLQVSGYLAWATALNVMGRSGAIAQVKQDGQERFQDQHQSLLISLMKAWPSGRYGIPKRRLNDACPSPSVAWKVGDMRWFTGADLPIMKFCMRADTERLAQEYRGEGDWPAGTYCIYQQGPSCPAGFDSGSISYKAMAGRLSKADGSLPEYSYTDKLILNYCCRSDGSTNTGIRLPPIVRFSLPRYGENCQEVLNMRMTDDKVDKSNWYRYPDRYVGDDGIPASSGSHPAIVRVHMFSYVPICYYDPAF